MKFDSPAADEWPLIFDSWAQSYRKSPWSGTVPNNLWDTVSRAAATDIITRGARVLVAYSELDGGGRRVMGYVVFEPGVLHWLYVKRDYRGFGVGKALLNAMFHSIEFPGAPDRWIYTHRTKASAKFLGKGFTWDPVPARRA